MENLGLTYSGSEVTDQEIFDAVPAEYQDLLKQTNGCVLFDGGLHIRGAVESPEWHSLRTVWHGDLALSKLFPAVEESDVPFAQDCLGDQFLLRSGTVYKLSSESGELESLEMDFETFMDNAEANPVEFLSLEPLLGFLEEGGTLQPGQLLNAYPPFIMEEAANGVSLKAIPMAQQISFLADLAKQIAALSKGSQLRIKLVDAQESES